ncbi:MAG TPA: DUF2207 domain-containing protein [Allosphingosinicella sp.]|jgi:uncharacterized membrane protein YgcG
MIRSRPVLALLLAALSLLAPGAARAQGEGERILLFRSDVVVARDGSLDVTETIRIRAEGDRFQHGIVRDFPTRYTRDGRSVRVGFEVEEVTRDGAEEPWDTEGISNGTRVKIGSAEEILARGEHVYTIRYTTTRQLGFFPGYDELYWNVTGTGWQFPIDVAEARIRLPEAAPFGQRAVYTGPAGSTATNARVVAESAGDIFFRTTAPLGAEEGLTVAVAWPKGIVQAPVPPSASAVWLADNGPIGAALLGIFGICAFYFHAWKKAGRGPLPGTVVPLFSPPGAMSAAALRYVRRMGYDNRTFAAALVESGVRGKIRLVEEDGGLLGKDRMRVEKTGDADGMEAPERDMLGALFAGGDTVEMSNANHETFAAAQKALREGLEARYLGTTFHTNKGWAWTGLLVVVGAVLLAGAVVTLTDPYAPPAAWASPLLGLGLVAAALLAGLRSRLARPGGSWLLAILAVLLAVCASLLVAATVAMAAEGGSRLNVAWMLLPLLTLPLALSAFSWMAAPTKEGRALMDQIAGFERYLSITEEARLESLHPPEKTPELFERFLAHAIALGVENRWAKRFHDVLAAASAEPDRQQGLGWYSGSSNAWSNPGRFATSVGASLASTAASASSAPGSSSGSGGGGSSGGGGGGGGGGGW